MLKLKNVRLVEFPRRPLSVQCILQNWCSVTIAVAANVLLSALHDYIFFFFFFCQIVKSMKKIWASKRGERIKTPRKNMFNYEKYSVTYVLLSQYEQRRLSPKESFLRVCKSVAIGKSKTVCMIVPVRAVFLPPFSQKFSALENLKITFRIGVFVLLELDDGTRWTPRNPLFSNISTQTSSGSKPYYRNTWNSISRWNFYVPMKSRMNAYTRTKNAAKKNAANGRKAFIEPKRIFGPGPGIWHTGQISSYAALFFFSFSTRFHHSKVQPGLAGR